MPSTFLAPVADYRDDFATTGTLKPGWKYLWNQPDNWVAGTGSGVPIFMGGSCAGTGVRPRGAGLHQTQVRSRREVR